MRNIIILAAIFFLAPPSVVRGQEPSARNEASLLAVLRSDAPAADKAIACKFLAVYGSSESVPDLARLLSDEQLASWARIALEVIPGQETNEALRKAAESLEGRLLVGVINSIGVRRDEKSVALLTDKLADPSVDVASASAAALGRIGNVAAAKALQKFFVDSPASIRSAVAEGCLLCADRFLGEGNSKGAMEMFDMVRRSEAPLQRKLEATRGAILARGEAGAEMLIEQLRSPDEKFFQIGLSTAREFPGNQLDRLLGAELAKIPAERGARLVEAMADRKETVDRAALAAAAASGPKPIRLAAIAALGRVGSIDCVPALIGIGLDSDAELAAAAKTALAELPDEKVSQQIVVGLKRARGGEYVLLLELVGQRRIDANDVLIAALEDPDSAVRAAALTSLGNVVPAERLSILISAVVAPKNPEDQPIAARALKAAAVRLPDREACAAELAAAIDRANVETKVSLLEILATVGGEKALTAVGNAAKSSTLELKDAASRLLGEWMTIDAAPVLLQLAKSGPADKYQTRALRGYIRIARQFTMSDDERVQMCQNALAAANQPAEKKLVLEISKRYPHPRMLALAMEIRKTPELNDDGTQAALVIAQSLGTTADELTKLFAEDRAAAASIEIVKAEYGSADTMVDVTKVVQAAARVGQFVLLSSSNYNTAFGGDPAAGVPKRLSIQYRLDGQAGTATFPENAIIFLPRPK